MRHSISASLIRLLILAVTLWYGVLTASAQTTAFSYQGQLNDGGSPANASYDMQFKLFNALIGGTQVGSTVALTSVAVSSGIFTVTLDFGASAFSGANCWLEISVRLVGAGGFTTLMPRQPLTATPYAIKSLNAVSADGLSNACVGCVSGTQIGTLPSGSSNYIQNTTTQQTANFNISGNGILGGMLSASAGVSGITATDSYLAAGVFGSTNTLNASGVIGEANNRNNKGVWGKSADGIGVFGLSADGLGVLGVSTNSSGVFGVSTTAHGVSGSSTSGVGVSGASTSGSGVNGTSRNGIGVSGYSTNGWAGHFTGRVDTVGTIRSTAQTVPPDGEGLEVIYSDGQGYLTSYDRSGSSYKPLNLEGSVLSLNIGSGGNVGIGGIPTATPGVRLQVAGNIRVGIGTTGCVKDANDDVIAGTCSSDLRFKQNITPFPNILHKITRLQPVHFYWRAEEFPNRHFGNEQSYGLIAQEVEEVLPELVTKDEEGYRAVNYSKLPLMMLQAFKEMKAEQDLLKLQNAKLQTRLATLERLMQQLAEQAEKTAFRQQ